ncbi:DinB family protein [Virgibacillus xinjiangensis]|uniref:DinB family protein n=1 Tax=Virgibacillus xinjiangensis TaxID=393090 RepID=A0ABV7CXS2_9BACI
MMEQLLFDHMEKVRKITLQSISRIPEEAADHIPEGFRNNIRWNFGHIAFIQEKLAYGVLGEETKIPDRFAGFFAPGTSPSDWEGKPPSLEEIEQVLTEQLERIKGTHHGRVEDELPEPFTNSAGITFSTAGETLMFNSFHEGMHLEAVKQIYRQWKLQSQRK